MEVTPIAGVHERESKGEAHDGAVQAMFNRIAPTYDRLNRMLSAGTDVLWRRRAIRELEGIPSGAILDLCAGTMDLTAMVARKFPGERVVAADFAATMLDLGRHKAPRADVVVADAMALPFRDGEFAGAICGFGMRNLSDPEKGAREARRVLAPGGVFVTLEFFRPASAITKAFHDAYAAFVLPTVGGMVSGDKRAYAYLAESMGRFLTRAEYEETLVKAGFRNVRGFDLTFGVASVVRAEVPR